MIFSKSRLISTLKKEIDRLRLALARVEGERDSFREMAKEAIQAAREKHFSTDSKRVQVVNPEEYASNYVEPKVKHCPECIVCVRSDSWPVQCKNCQTWFGDELDAEFIGDTEGPP